MTPSRAQQIKKERMEKLIRSLEESLKKPEGKTSEEKKDEQEISEISSEKDYWTISGVNYRNQTCEVNLLKTLLDNGTARTQDEWAEYSRQAKQKNDFYVGDFPLYHALFRAMYNARNSDETEQARAFLKKQFEEKWLTSLTRIKYMPQGKDIIIHNYGLKDKIEIPENFIGKDEWVKDSSTSEIYNSLLGSNNIQEINEVYKWIANVPAYLWRVNSKPNSIDERVARFGADSDRVNLDCYGSPQYVNPSLGVRFASMPAGMRASQKFLRGGK